MQLHSPGRAIQIKQNYILVSNTAGKYIHTVLPVTGKQLMKI